MKFEGVGNLFVELLFLEEFEIFDSDEDFEMEWVLVKLGRSKKGLFFVFDWKLLELKYLKFLLRKLKKKRYVFFFEFSDESLDGFWDRKWYCKYRYLLKKKSFSRWYRLRCIKDDFDIDFSSDVEFEFCYRYSKGWYFKDCKDRRLEKKRDVDYSDYDDRKKRKVEKSRDVEEGEIED